MKHCLSFICNALLIQDYIPDSAFYFGFNGPVWYLCMAFFFYLVSPLAVRFWNRIQKEKTILLIFAGILAVEFSLVFIIGSKPYGHWLIYVFPPVRVLDFILGGGVWKLCQIRMKGKTHSTLWEYWEKYGFIMGIIIGAVTACFSVTRNNELFSVALWGLPCLLIIPVIDNSTAAARAMFANRAATFLGKISFGFFLIHYPCICYLDLLAKKLGVHSIPAVVFTEFAISVSLALLYRYLHNRLSAGSPKTP